VHCVELFNIVTGFMEAQVNLQGGSRWSPEDSFINRLGPILTVVSDSVVEKVGTQMYFVLLIIIIIIILSAVKHLETS
jgi:hypothetical protein